MQKEIGYVVNCFQICIFELLETAGKDETSAVDGL